MTLAWHGVTSKFKSTRAADWFMVNCPAGCDSIEACEAEVVDFGNTGGIE
jgi:hypothetical protein